MVGVLVIMAEKGIHTILVVRLSSIGDIILTTPVVARLRKAFPSSRIDFCTRAPFVPLLASNPAITTVCTPETLPSARYDLVVDLQNNRRSRAMIRRLESGRVARYRKENWKKLLLVRLKLNFYGDDAPSVVDRYLFSLHGSIPDDPDGSSCRLYPSAADRAFAAGIIDGWSGPILSVCFGAHHFTKRYPASGFASIISTVAAAVDVRILLLGGRDEAADGERILDALPETLRSSVRSVAGNCSLMETAALLERSDLVLCNDTGLMHMASAFGRKLFVLFGSSKREFGFLPYRTPCELFEVQGLRCRPCSHIGRDRCPAGHFRCMNDLPAGRIAAMLIDELRRNPE